MITGISIKDSYQYILPLFPYHKSNYTKTNRVIDNLYANIWIDQWSILLKRAIDSYFLSKTLLSELWFYECQQRDYIYQ
jgi:hypothetical protein